jgi:hypothetical protein
VDVERRVDHLSTWSLDHYFLHRMRKNEGNGDEVKLTEARSAGSPTGS